MTSLVVLFSNQIKLNVSKSKAVTKILSRSYTVILTDLFNAIKKSRGKFRFINTLKTVIFVKYDLLTEYPTMFWFNLLVNKCKLVFRIRIKKSSKNVTF